MRSGQKDLVVSILIVLFLAGTYLMIPHLPTLLAPQILISLLPVLLQKPLFFLFLEGVKNRRMPHHLTIFLFLGLPLVMFFYVFVLYLHFEIVAYDLPHVCIGLFGGRVVIIYHSLFVAQLVHYLLV